MQFSSEGSRDPDPADSISFEWDFDGNGTVDSVDPNPSFTYTANGVYTARLTVTDSSGKTASANTTITVGNTSPTVNVTVPVDGGLFAFGDTIPFAVTVTDPEDGPIDCSRVEVTFVLGHDSHGHAEATANGCTGTLPTDAEDVSHGGNVFGIISASYTDLGGAAGVPALTTVDQAPILQKRQEVEFAVDQSGTNTAPTADTGGGLQRGSLGNGDWIALNGTLQPGQHRLADVPHVGRQRRPAPVGRGPPRRGRRADPHHGDDRGHGERAPRTRARPSRSPTPAARTGSTWCSARSTGGPGNNFFNLNWVEFGGAGREPPPAAG